MNRKTIKFATAVLLLLAGAAWAQQSAGQKHQHGQPSGAGGKMCCQEMACSNMEQKGAMCCGQGAEGRGMQRGGQGMSADMPVIHTLLDNHQKITRRVKEIPGGIESWTESDDPQLVPLIQKHLASMKERIEKGNPIHQRDPLFREIFENADRIEIRIENTAKGVYVTETSKDPRVVELIRAHAQAVDGFVREGHSEAMKNHTVPQKRN